MEEEQEHPFQGQARVSGQPAASLSGRQEAVGMKADTSTGAASFLSQNSEALLPALSALLP